MEKNKFILQAMAYPCVCRLVCRNLVMSVCNDLNIYIFQLVKCRSILKIALEHLQLELQNLDAMQKITVCGVLHQLMVDLGVCQVAYKLNKRFLQIYLSFDLFTVSE